MEADHSENEMDEKDLSISDASEVDDSDSSGVDDSNNTELLHSCPYCPKVQVDMIKSETRESNQLKGHFVFNTEELYTAVTNGCELMARLVDPVEVLLRRTVPGYLRHDYAATTRRLELWNDLGVTLSAGDRPNAVVAKVGWAKEDESFYHPAVYFNESSQATTKCSAEQLSRALEQVRHKLEDCHQMHPCAKQNFVPLRLIRIQGDNHIVLETPEDGVVRYTALSYCWGKGNNFIALRRRLVTMATGIPIKKLPKTIRDAIHVTRQLQLQYLWVDSLCIVQDDVGEKYFQISQMPQIYKGAYITIAASSARECSQGFLNAELKTHALYQLPCIFTDQVADITLVARVAQSLDSLDSRAWALQERMLSTRVVDFRSHEIYYGCTMTHLSLDISTGQPKVEKSVFSSATSGISLVETLMKHIRGGLYSRQQNMNTWYRIVEAYSIRNLSFPEDKLLAISGIADQFAKDSSLTNDDCYLGGLWRSSLPRSLLWICLNPRKRPTRYRAPAWSWASVDGEISYTLSDYSTNDDEREIEIWDSRVSLMLEESKYGALLSSPPGRICVSGLMKLAEWIKNRTRLRDPYSGLELDVETYPDFLESRQPESTIPVYLLNFWQPKGIDRTKDKQDLSEATNLRPTGFILTRLNDATSQLQEEIRVEGSTSGEYYRRIGLYHGTGYSKAAFINSERKAVTIV